MKDIHWLINRLKSMNAPEIVWRVTQKMLQKKEKRSVYSLHLPVTQIPLSKGLQGLKADVNRVPFNVQNDNYSVFETLDIFDQFDYQLYKKKWNAGFQTENTWPEEEFSANISISQREDIGDIRTNWELNRHFQFSCLAKNYYLTGEREYLGDLVDLFEDWNKHNLFLHGPEWTSAMEVGIRVNSWIFAYVFLYHGLEKYEAKNRDILEKLSHGILVMTEYVVNHRARFSSANNHLIVEMYAVGMAGFLFGNHNWIKLSINTLTEELPKQNYEDGVNKEMSLHYQSFVMEAYGLMCLTMMKNNCEIPQVWLKYLSSMSRYLADCCGDYGEVVVFGDNDEGKLLDLQGKVDDHYRYVLQLMGMCLKNRFTDYPIVENIYWITDLEQQKKYTKKDLYLPGLVSHYKAGGYTILRSSDRRVLLAMDHADLAYESIAAHGHADALSIQLFYEGNPVLVDSGTFNYHVPKAVRNTVRSALAHNTVYVDGIEQAEMLGPFLWGKRFVISGVECNEEEFFVIIKSTVMYDSIKHTRELYFDFDRTVSVADDIQSDRDSIQTWIFDKDFYDDKNRYSLNFENDYIEDDVYYSPNYGQTIEGVKISVRFKKKTSMKLFLGDMKDENRANKKVK